MVSIGPRWRTTDIEAVADRLRAHLGSGPLRLLHAQGNLIWTDGEYAYKLTDSRVRQRSETHLRAVAALLDADRCFPTIAPASFSVRDVDFAEHGAWALTVWNYVELRTVRDDPNDARAYAQLGALLGRVHAIEMPWLDRHDPLVWARHRVSALAEAAPDLHEELVSLERRHAQAFPANEDVTVHGDVHWHQVTYDVRGGMWLLDFENAALGHPSVDLVPSAGWVRRTGMPTGEDLAALHAGYGQDAMTLTAEQVQVSDDIARFSLRTWRLLHG